MQCRICSTINSDQARYCSCCGAFLLSTASAPCDQPGHSLPASPLLMEQKLVTILSASVSSTGDISNPPSPSALLGAEYIMRVFADEIISHSGQISKLTETRMVAVFGITETDNSHARSACSCALAIAHALKEYDFILNTPVSSYTCCMVINTGHMIIDYESNEALFSSEPGLSTVQVADQLKTTAPPGSIIVSATAEPMVRGFFEIRPLLAAPGVGDTMSGIPLFELLLPAETAPITPVRQNEGSVKFVGRREELRILLHAFSEACAGRGHIIEIAGEAGVGKTRLVQEFIKSLNPDSLRYLEGQCLIYGGSMPYLPIIDILRALFEMQNGTEEALSLNILKKATALDDTLAPLLPPLLELLCLKKDDAAGSMPDPLQKREGIFTSLRALLLAASRVGTLVIVIENMHWIDRTSRQFFESLIPSIANAHILMIQIFRPECPPLACPNTPRTRINLGQLSPVESAELLRSVLGGSEISPELHDFIAARGEGNPLFVKELASSLLENGSIIRRGATFVLNGKHRRDTLPVTLREIISMRISSLDESIRCAIEVASVVGNEFLHHILQTIASVKGDVQASLADLEGLEFLYQKQLFPELESVFTHALTEEVAYSTLTLSRRQEVHETVGKAIEQLYGARIREFYPLLAYHYSQSMNSQKALEYLALSNQKAISEGAAEEARLFFEQLLSLLDSLPDTDETRCARIKSLTDQLPVYWRLMKIPDYCGMLIRYKQQAFSMGDPELQGIYLSRLGMALWCLGDFLQASQAFSKAAELCAAVGSQSHAAMASIGLSWSFVFLGESDKAAALERTGSLTDDIAHSPVFQEQLYLSFAWAYYQLGRFDEALRSAQVALQPAEQAGCKSQAYFAGLFMICFFHVCRGDIEKASTVLDQAESHAAMPFERLWRQGLRGFVLCRSSDAAQGAALLQDFLAGMHQASFMPGILYGMLWLAEALLRAGDSDQAHKTLAELMPKASAAHAQFICGSAHRLLGLIISPSDAAEGEKHFMAARDIFGAIKAGHERSLTLAHLARLLRLKGHREEACRCFREAIEGLAACGAVGEPERIAEELRQLETA